MPRGWLSSDDWLKSWRWASFTDNFWCLDADPLGCFGASSCKSTRWRNKALFAARFIRLQRSVSVPASASTRSRLDSIDICPTAACCGDDNGLGCNISLMGSSDTGLAQLQRFSTLPAPPPHRLIRPSISTLAPPVRNTRQCDTASLHSDLRIFFLIVACYCREG